MVGVDWGVASVGGVGQRRLGSVIAIDSGCRHKKEGTNLFSVKAKENKSVPLFLLISCR